MNSRSNILGKQWNESLEEKVNILVDNGCEDNDPQGHTEFKKYKQLRSGVTSRSDCPLYFYFLFLFYM